MAADRRCGGWGGRGCGLFSSLAGLELFKLEFQLSEFVGELLALHLELHGPVLLDELLQMLDLVSVRGLLSDQQSLQGLPIERVQISHRITMSLCP